MHAPHRCIDRPRRPRYEQSRIRTVNGEFRPKKAGREHTWTMTRPDTRRAEIPLPGSHDFSGNEFAVLGQLLSEQAYDSRTRQDMLLAITDVAFGEVPGGPDDERDAVGGFQ